MRLQPLPSVDELLRDPAKATTLPPETARTLYVQVAALQAALSTALLPSSITPPVPSRNGDRFLGPGDVAEKIGKSRSWVEKHVAELPPRRRVGGEALWSERELDTWMKTRPVWGEG